MPIASVVNPSKGAKLLHGVGTGPVVYTEITQIVELGGPTREILTRETTNLDSAAKTYDVAIPEGGEVTASIQWDPQSDSHQILETLATTPALASWQVKLGDTTNGGTGSTVSFQGILTKPPQPNGMKREENLLADIAIKVSGLITVALGA